MKTIMKTTQSLMTKGSMLVLSLALLGGCDLFKKKDSAKDESGVSKSSDEGVVLCTIDGEPAVKEGEFVASLTQMIQANPYFKGATIESLPKDLLRKFFDQLSTQALIEKHSVKNNVEKDPEYIKAYNETEKQLKRMLMVQIFEKKIYDSIKIDEADIKKYYDENKDRFIKAPGGVLVLGVAFDKEADANAFVDKAKAAGDFEKLAKASSGKFKDFGRVSKEARGMQPDMVPAPIKEAALAMNSSGVEKVKAGKEFWVIKVSDKQDSVLFDIGEVKSHVEAILKNNSYRDVLEKSVKELKDKHTVIVNDDYFKEKAAPQGDVKDETMGGMDTEDKSDGQDSVTSAA